MHEIVCKVLQKESTSEMKHGVVMTLAISKTSSLLTLWHTQSWSSECPSSMLNTAISEAKREIKIRRQQANENFQICEFDGAGLFNRINERQNGRFAWTSIKGKRGLNGYLELHGQLAELSVNHAKKCMKQSGLQMLHITSENSTDRIKILGQNE
jgi:hypothetical protein